MITLTSSNPDEMTGVMSRVDDFEFGLITVVVEENGYNTGKGIAGHLLRIF
jgi:hypothetical protein